jgi:hypothetical protein
VRVTFSPASSPAFVAVCFLDDSHSDLGEMNYNVIYNVLIYIPLMAKHVEHFFMYPLALCTSSFEKCLFSSFVHLLIGSFIF